MSTTIVMPQLGESVAEGVIGKWLKAEGDPIERDEPIVEVITDKVTAEIPSPVSGVLETITAGEGVTVAVGQEIAVIGDGGAPARREEPAAVGAGGSAPSGGGGDGNGQAPAGATAVQSRPASGAGERSAARGERVRSSPLVRRLADQYGINLAEVPGTGIGGRVSKGDIMAFIEHQKAASTLAAGAATPQVARPPLPTHPQGPQAAPAAPPRPAGANDEAVPLSPIRKMIADRMALSMTSIPHATTMVEVDMTNVVRYREARKAEFRQREGVPLSYVAIVIKATVDALKEYPDVNAEWGGDHILRRSDININVAVDAPEGLTTPVIHHADEKSLAGLSKGVVDLAERARDRKLRIEDMQGGTFTVNNTGALGSVSGVSIINPPQAGILSAAAIVKRPVVLEHEGQDLIAVRPMMNLILSFDHRVLDGGYASGFVSAVKAKLEAWAIDYPVY
jgi:2-oxoisovalerate dehydrogenase E2 component (dihydrolipoyl transacylase)